MLLKEWWIDPNKDSVDHYFIMEQFVNLTRTNVLRFAPKKTSMLKYNNFFFHKINDFLYQRGPIKDLMKSNLLHIYMIKVTARTVRKLALTKKGAYGRERVNVSISGQWIP